MHRSDCEFQLPDGDESQKQRKERQLETAKKRLANSEVVRDLHREYTDGPDEIRVSNADVILNSDMPLVNEYRLYIAVVLNIPVPSLGSGVKVIRIGSALFPCRRS